MALTYQTGEEIHRGDRVTYGGNAGVVELVVEGFPTTTRTNWHYEAARALIAGELGG